MLKRKEKYYYLGSRPRTHLEKKRFKRRSDLTLDWFLPKMCRRLRSLLDSESLSMTPPPKSLGSQRSRIIKAAYSFQGQNIA